MKLGSIVAAGLGDLWFRLLPTGEVPMSRKDVLDPDGGRIACSNVLASTLIHDVLACFDPMSRDNDPTCLARMDPAPRKTALRYAVAIRRRIRRFVAWQESAHGGWSFYGRTSGMSSDSPTTACAAAVLLDGLGPARWSARREATISAYRRKDGRFHTGFRAGRGYGTLRDDGSCSEEPDRVFNAHVLRFAHFYGLERDALNRWLAEELNGNRMIGSPHHPSPMAFYHALARAYRVAFPTPGERLLDELAARILSHRGEDGSLDGRLDTALGVLALLDIERAALLDSEMCNILRRGATGPAQLDPGAYFGGAMGSTVFTRTLELTALARLALVHGHEEQT